LPVHVVEAVGELRVRIELAAPGVLPAVAGPELAGPGAVRPARRGEEEGVRPVETREAQAIALHGSREPAEIAGRHQERPLDAVVAAQLALAQDEDARFLALVEADGPAALERARRSGAEEQEARPGPGPRVELQRRPPVGARALLPLAVELRAERR